MTPAPEEQAPRRPDMNATEQPTKLEAIPFTQFLMPDGRRKADAITRPQKVMDAAQVLIAAGVRFEMELLSDYSTVSFEAVMDGDDEDPISLAHVLCKNGPEVPLTVDKLVADATRARALAKAGGA